MKVSIVTPTFNEAENICQFLAELRRHLARCDYEIIVVDDDSPDLTWKVAASEMAGADHRIRVLRRTERRGLGNSVIDGFKHSGGDAIACMDADFQHDPAILPEMLAALERGGDIVVASRYAEGGATGEWSLVRSAGSKLATRLAKFMLGVRIHDPMSGYFMLRRKDFQRVSEQLNGDGFKIMLEILVHLKPSNVVEVPYTFRSRLAGTSKLSSIVIFDYMRQLCRLSTSAGRLPGRFVKFASVGLIGAIVNLCVLALLIQFTSLRDWRASVLSSLTAMTNNYVLNNAWTFGDRKIRGLKHFASCALYFLISFCGLGVTTAAYAAISYVLVSSFGVAPRGQLPNSVLLLIQLISISFGTYTNYSLNKHFTWRPQPQEPKPAAQPVEVLEAGQQTRAA